MNDADQWIRALQLSPHAEGGWYREVYRSNEVVSQASLPGRFSGDRCFSTAIYYLLKGSEFSALHRIRQDELWHFYDGAPLTIHTIDLAGVYSSVMLGRSIRGGEVPVATVSAGCIFGAAVSDTEAYSLIGCTVAPGFEFDDFEMPNRNELLMQFPQHRQIIERLTNR